MYLLNEIEPLPKCAFLRKYFATREEIQTTNRPPPSFQFANFPPHFSICQNQVGGSGYRNGFGLVGHSCCLPLLPSSKTKTELKGMSSQIVFAANSRKREFSKGEVEINIPVKGTVLSLHTLRRYKDL